MRIILVTIALLAACGPSQSDVRAEIQKAGFCTTAADCVDVGSVCPYGCNIVVNASRAADIRSLLDRSESGCAYDCRALTTIACEAQACVAQYD